MRKYFRATEIAWLVMSVIGVVTTVYMLIQKNSDNALFCLMISVFCLVMWRMRRIYNRKLEAHDRKNQNGSKP